MVCVGRDLKDVSFQPPCHGHAHFPLEQVAQSLIQPGLGHCQGEGSHSFSGQPGPGPHHPHSEESNLYLISAPWLCRACFWVSPHFLVYGRPGRVLETSAMEEENCPWVLASPDTGVWFNCL